MNSFFDREIGQWHLSFFSQSHLDGGVQGYADIHDGFELHCRISLSMNFDNEDALGAALEAKCLAWLKEWDTRYLSSPEPSLLPNITSM